MENQHQNQESGDLEQSEQGQGSSGLEQQQSGDEHRDNDNNQNDIAGNAGGNEHGGVNRDASGAGGSDTRGEDSQRQRESLPSDGPVSRDEGDNNEDLNDIETDNDDELPAND